MAIESHAPGTYRVADNTRVDFASAVAAWTPIAYEELKRTAGRYHGVTTYLELSERVQDVSGVRTRMLLTNWIGKLLEAVAAQAAADGEPPLTSLCVRQDGTIGPGYERAPKSVDDEPGEDIEFYAARHRLLCYRKYAVDLPSDGGHAALTQAERQRRERKARQPEPDRPRVLCATCFTQLPAAGTCDYCS